jgi:hypothetical protein
MAAFHRFPLLVLFYTHTQRMTPQDVIWAQFFHSTWWFKMIAVVLLIILRSFSAGFLLLSFFP